MSYSQKTCEDCGMRFTDRSSIAASIAWAEHIRTKECVTLMDADADQFDMEEGDH